MAPKRDIDSLVYSDTENIPAMEGNKRQKKQPVKSKRQPAVDPTYGQKFALPITEGLGAPSDDDLELEDQSEALAYLRSVQQETSKIPHVVVAPKAGPQLPPGYTLPSDNDDDLDMTVYQTGIGDSRGYYYDGAYTAAPDYASSSVAEEGEYRDDDDGNNGSGTARNPTAATLAAALSESYFSSLTARFAALRSLLHSEPPQSALDALPPDHETSVPSFAPHKPTFRTWTHRLRYTDPLPAQVAAMDKVSVLRLLRVVLGGKFFRRGCALRPRTSRWVWALLARLPDRGQMDSDEIGAVREMGKRAVLVSISREHVAALCEVLGREGVAGLGLAGVLREIEGGSRQAGRRAEAEEEDVEEEEAEAEVQVEVVNEDEIRLTPDRAGNGRAVPGDGADGGTAQPDDLEDGELPDEEVPAAEAQFPVAVDGTDEGEVPMDIEEGEVAPGDKDAALAALKARLLSDLDKAETWDERQRRPPSPPAAAAKEAATTDDNDEASEADSVNMRATVNMILTVAGEFYGQRDLLAFRDPFGDLPFETAVDGE